MTHDLSGLDVNLLGVLTDAELARLFDCHVNTIAAYRKRMGRRNATTLGGDSRAFQLRMPISLMALIREVDERRVAVGCRSNFSRVIRDAIRVGLPMLEA